jgi:phytoene/squalene synthetase
MRRLKQKKVGMSENEVIEAARATWNAQADEHNQWDELGCDEKLELAVRAAFETWSAQEVVAWITEDGERVITDATKRGLPRAVQAPYTRPLVRATLGETLPDGEQ